MNFIYEHIFCLEDFTAINVNVALIFNTVLPQSIYFSIGKTDILQHTWKQTTDSKTYKPDAKLHQEFRSTEGICCNLCKHFGQNIPCLTVEEEKVQSASQSTA